MHAVGALPGLPPALGFTPLPALPAADTDAQYGAGGSSGYRHDYEGWDSFLYGQGAAAGGGASLEEAADPAAAAAQWEAWHAWQAQHPGGHYPQPGGAEDSYVRYMRPDDVYWEQHAQQQEAHQGGTSGAAAAAAAEDGRPENCDQAAENADEVAQEALGLIGGYGSDSDSERRKGDEHAADGGG